MRWYSEQKHRFAQVISTKNYKTREGRTPSSEDILEAIHAAEEVDNLRDKHK